MSGWEEDDARRRWAMGGRGDSPGSDVGEEEAHHERIGGGDDTLQDARGLSVDDGAMVAVAVCAPGSASSLACGGSGGPTHLRAVVVDSEGWFSTRLRQQQPVATVVAV
ncbi:unnamed protein product [Urochloa humidicola]